MTSTATLSFETPPPVPWLRLVLGRRRWTGEVPPLSATLAPAPLTVPERYRELCGFPDGAVPLTWPQVAAAPLHAQLLAHPDFPLRAMGLVHVWQRCSATRDLDPREPVTLRAWFDGHRPAKRGVEVDLLTAAEVEGEAVWTGHTRFLARSVPGDGVDRPVEEPVPTEAELTESWTLSADLGRRYARVARDRNPIHQYAWSARLFGFERAIVHGMWTLGRAQAAIDPAAREVEGTFRRPVLLPGRLTLTADADGRFAVLADGADRPSLIGRVGGADGPERPL